MFDDDPSAPAALRRRSRTPATPHHCASCMRSGSRWNISAGNAASSSDERDAEIAGQIEDVLELVSK